MPIEQLKFSRFPVKRLLKKENELEVELTLEEYKKTCLLFSEYLSEQIYYEYKLKNLRNELRFEDILVNAEN